MFLVHLLREVVGGGIPGDSAFVLIGQEFQGRSLVQVHDEHEFLVHLGNLLVETLLLLSLVELLDVRTEDIAVLSEEIVHAGIVGDAEAALQFSALHLDDRFFYPVIVEEDKAGEYLFRRIFPIRALAIELLGEVDGVGLYRTYPVVIHHEELSELLGSLFRQHTGGGVKR